MRVAAIDIGTNTVLLLIADIVKGDLSVLIDDHAIARLGEGVDKTGLISEAAYQRLREKLIQHSITIDHFAPVAVAAIATSAMRDAKNSDKIRERAKRDTGIEIEVIAGEDEARWTFFGSILALALDPGKPVVVVDIGGGSTELAVGSTIAFERGTSTQIGAVRLTERAHAENLSIDTAAAMVRRSFRDFEIVRNATLISVAGTPTSLAAIDLNLDAFDADKIHGHRLSLDAIERILEDIWDAPTEEIVSRYPVVNPGRADILAAGTLILREVLRFLNLTECIVSTRGLRYGIAIRAAFVQSLKDRA